MLQCAGRRRESPREVVPGPTASEARRLERAVVEGVVVTDDPPGDAAYTEASQLVGPADEGIPGAGRVERRNRPPRAPRSRVLPPIYRLEGAGTPGKEIHTADQKSCSSKRDTLAPRNTLACVLPPAEGHAVVNELRVATQENGPVQHVAQARQIVP